MEGNVLFAFSLTLFAGLSTGIGSLLGLLSKKFNPKVLTISLGFSAGVMLYVSMIEIFVKAKDSLSMVLGAKEGHILTVVAFFSGILLIALIVFFITIRRSQSKTKLSTTARAKAASLLDEGR